MALHWSCVVVNITWFSSTVPTRPESMVSIQDTVASGPALVVSPGTLVNWADCQLEAVRGPVGCQLEAVRGPVGCVVC